MVFNSLVFLVFFLVVFPLYWWINKTGKVNRRNVFVIAASYLFYGWWDYRFLALIVLSSAVDYLAGARIYREKTRIRKRMWLGLSLLVNLGTLAFFKYANFFVDTFYDAFGITAAEHFSTLDIILPVGISFYTFQTLSYTLDIYRGRLQPTKNATAFFAFVAFFPQLVAGPIERASALLPQFLQRQSFDYQKGVSGLRLTLWGLFKKVVVADGVGLLVDAFFTSSLNNAWIPVLGAVLFGVQIYADFSGYSDIAIGIARLLGFELRTNFDTPYFSKSFKTFWTRWHISLSTWFRDYVYIPLGGSRGKQVRNMGALMATFLLSGLWHGADYTFVIWGGLHGAVLLLERRLPKPWLRTSAYGVAVFLTVMLLWLPFRAEHMQHLTALTATIAQGTWSMGPIVDLATTVFTVHRLVVLGVVFVAFIGVEYRLQGRSFDRWVGGLPNYARYITYYGLVLCLIALANLDVKPDFIYFQF